MTDISQQVEVSETKRVAGRNGALLAISFSSSMLLSALLLFLVQPIFAKMTLPLLGGSPGVWNTAMVFFQAVLLGGYVYAHLLSKFFTFRTQIAIHGALMIAATVFLPIAIPANWTPPTDAMPIFWLIGLFTVSLGLPFFALSANAPLLQKWFSYTDHKSASDPYFLYAASNFGSLVSLLCYPTVIEPFARATSQTGGWAIGFVVLIFAIIGSGVLAYNNRSAETKNSKSAAQDEPQQGESTPVTWTDRGNWILSAAIPSGLMLGVTAYMTANVAAAPFLWVMPLALYLATFIIVFANQQIISRKWIQILGFVSILAATILVLTPGLPIALVWTLHLTAYFFIALMCHDRLASSRPDVSRLTEFYMFMSLGGVIGGAFIALGAPIVFNGAYEYVVMLVISALMLGKLEIDRSNLRRELLVISAIIVAAVMVHLAVVSPVKALKAGAIIFTVVGVFSAMFLSRKNPLRATFILSVFWTVLMFIPPDAENRVKVIERDRSFFGVLKTVEDQSEYGRIHKFFHGNTIHNIQLEPGTLPAYPLSYYAPETSFGQAVAALREARGNIDVAVVGLGAGAMACHVRKEENWAFYEIDPRVVEMARNPNLFTYVKDCAPEVPIVVGDARLTLQNAEEKSLDLIMIDAFSSNSIPAHLVAKEAMSLYQSRLKDGGFVFFHTTNRHLDVTSVVLNVAEAVGLSARVNDFIPDDTMKYHELIHPTIGVMVGKSDEDLDQLFSAYPGWKKQNGNPDVGVWSDDYSHILGALISRMQKFGRSD